MDDDDNSWIPLSPSTSGDNTASHNDDVATAATVHENVSSARTKPSRRTRNLEQRLETRLNLKSNLVDHPIDLFWKRYLFNFAREVWALEWHIRLGLCMVVTGILIKLFLVSTWYFWYPRFVIVACMLVAATIYVDIFDLQRHLDAVCKGLLNPEKILQILQQLDSTGLRRLTVVMLLVPTILEMRTLSFLSGIKAETGWIVYNTFLSGALMGLMMYWFRVLSIQPRECLYRGLLVLYGSALWITIYKTDLSRMPRLAAPFLTSTGTILITYQDDDMEWMSRVLRHSLRLTLRDVLASIGGKVSEDEMLQLAILRWIADYWASAPGPSPAGTPMDQPPRRNESTGTNTQTNTESATGVAASTTAAQGPPHETNTAVPQQSSSSSLPRRPSSILQRRHDVTWEELLPMLNVATDYMASEVEMLRPDHSSENTNPPAKKSSSNPVESFHDMLRSLSVDERAGPAVQAYKSAVESFPPKHHTVVLLSVMRRSPALLTILWHVLFFKPDVCTCTLILLPFVAMEYQRIKYWIRSCEEVKHAFKSVESTEDYPYLIPSVLRDSDPLVILLVGDSYNPARPPALLLVWQNVLNSVSALEVGLTAARCAETTAVAVQFAGNMLSLVQFGQEIQQHGILHGLLVMGKEAILYHTMDDRVRNREATKYTMAVVDAIENAQQVARNIQMLANDDKVGHIFQPVVGLACALSGYGWLWGNETKVAENAEGTSSNPRSDEDLATRSATTTTGPDNIDDSPSSADSKQPIKEVSSLSDVMDEIAEAFANGEITKEQKDELCETLSRCAEESVTTLDVVRKALMEFVKNNKNHPPFESTAHERVNPSAAMEMVLSAYYSGLIDQAEKLAFCRIIASLGDGEESDMEAGEKMIRELTSILQRGEPVEVRKAASSSSPTLGSHDAQGHGSATREEPAKCTNETVDIKTDSGSKICDESNIATSQLEPILPENEQRFSESARQTDSGHESTSSPQTDQAERGSNDAWLRFGMATLSVVVGGMLMSRNEEGDQRHRQEQEAPHGADPGASTGNSGSTVEIEELHDEVEEEWVSVPQ